MFYATIQIACVFDYQKVMLQFTHSISFQYTGLDVIIPSAKIQGNHITYQITYSEAPAQPTS